MGKVSSSIVVPGRIATAEDLWYDLARWPAFVDGFAAVVQCDTPWPAAGGKLIWDSTPHGRGRIIERVTAHGAREGQTVEFEDERLEGTQRVSFAGEGEQTRVGLVLDYRLKDRNPLTPIVDLLFVRRAVGDALRRTLTRYARELQADLELS